MMKRILACMMTAMLLLACAGCGEKKSGEAAEEKILTGTLDEVKDFMFVVSDQNGTSYLQEKSYQEVADEVGVSKVTVFNHLSKAMDWIKEQFK